MRPLSIGSPPSDTDGRINWLVDAIQKIALASQEEPAEVFDSYSSDTAATVTRTLNVSSPTTANLAAVLSTLISDMQARGVNRVGPT